MVGGYAILLVPSTPFNKPAKVLEPLKVHVTDDEIEIPVLFELFALVHVISESSTTPSLSSSKSNISLMPSPSESKHAFILAFNAFVL